MLVKNSPLAGAYNALLLLPVEVRVGPLHLAKPAVLWVNDGLMAIFFLLIGLEVKREFLEGQLAKWQQVGLPAIAALGGMIVPALIYALFNRRDPVSLYGWAIPTATDIAFALGVLSLVRPKVPVGLKLFLLTLAIFDDLGAMVVIALFYAGKLSTTSLVFAFLAFGVLIALNLSGKRTVGPYVVAGLLFWICVLKSGVHATLAGVLIAFTIPMRTGPGHSESLLHHVEQSLHPWVTFGILPLFAFTNSGVSFEGFSLTKLLDPVPVGIAAGLFFGKQIGVFAFSWLAVKLGLARLPEGSRWLQLYGVSILCGIGFTMSLFIGGLAFAEGQAGYAKADRLGILIGSFASALVGYLVLRTAGSANTAPRRSEIATRLDAG